MQDLNLLDRFLDIEFNNKLDVTDKENEYDTFSYMSMGGAKYVIFELYAPRNVKLSYSIMKKICDGNVRIERVKDGEEVNSNTIFHDIVISNKNHKMKLTAFIQTVEIYVSNERLNEFIRYFSEGPIY